MKRTNYTGIAAFAALSVGCDVVFAARFRSWGFHWHCFLDCHGFQLAFADAINWSLLGAWSVFRVLHILCVVLGWPVAYKRFVVALTGIIMMGCFVLGSFIFEAMDGGAYSAKPTFFEQLIEIWNFGNRPGTGFQIWGNVLPESLVFFLWIIVVQLSSVAATEATRRRMLWILNRGSRRTHGGINR